MLDDQHNALVVDGATKLYPVLDGTWQGIRYLFRMARGDVDYVRQVNHVPALTDVSFTVANGERVGVVGRNGSGKSTLLNLIAGAVEPTYGAARAVGKVFLLSSGTVGFNPELTVRQNVRSFLGQHEQDGAQLTAQLAEVRRFTELGPYFDQPLKYCSLGMRARAEFATATAVDASLVLVDEVLGAGDLHWAERCARRVEEFCSKGRAVILVSHSMDQILRYCNRVIWLDSGRIVMDDDAHQVVRRYEGYLERLSWLGDDIEDKTMNWKTERQFYEDVVLEDSGSHVSRWPGIGGVTVNGLWLNDSPILEQDVFREDALLFAMTLRCNQEGRFRLRYMLIFWSPTGKRMGVAENDCDELEMEAGQKHRVSLRIEESIIGEGTYYVTVAVFMLGVGGSTAIEKDSRHDVIYKSIRLVVASRQSQARPGKQQLRFTAPFESRLYELSEST